MADAYEDNATLAFIDRFVDICFGFDIVFMFLTAYIDIVNGETIRQPKLIARHYLLNGFFLDFMSTLPLILKPLVPQGSKLQSVIVAFRLLKLLRVRRLNTLITNLDIPVTNKSHMKRVYVCFILFLFIHIQGCILYLVFS